MSTITLEPLLASLKGVCEKHGVRRLRLFGSSAAGTNRPDSDVDLLVDYVPGHLETLHSITALEEDLQELFDGRTIDLVNPELLHWFIRDSVLESAKTLYER